MPRQGESVRVGAALLVVLASGCHRAPGAPASSARADVAVARAPLGPGRWLPVAPLRLVSDEGAERIALSAAGEVRLGGVAAGRIEGDRVVGTGGAPLLEVGSDGVIALNFEADGRPFTTGQGPRFSPEGMLWTRLGDFAVGAEGVPTIARREVDPGASPARTVGVGAGTPERAHARFEGYRPALQSTAVALMLLEMNGRPEAHIQLPAPRGDR